MSDIYRYLRRIRPVHLILALVCLSFALPLASYARIGSFMRYSGDDYCYGAVLSQQGFLKAQWYSYFNLTPFHGNRYSLTFVSSLAGVLPPVANGLLPGLMIVLWVGGLTWGICLMQELLYDAQNKLAALLMAVFLVFLTFYQAPDLSQSLYWRSGMLPYLAPLVSGTLIACLILWYVERRTDSKVALLVLGVAAFFSAGFSETGTVLQASFLSLALLGIVSSKRWRARWADRALLPIGIALFGTCLGLLALILSPPNQQRWLNLPAPPHVLIVAELSFRHANDFISGTFKALPTPSIYTAAFSFVLAVINANQWKGADSFGVRRVLLLILTAVLAVYLLVVSCMLPFAYTQQVYPEPRALILCRFIMVLGVSFIGLVLGRWSFGFVSQVSKRKSLSNIIALILLCLMAYYPIRAARIVLIDVPRYSKWAAFWDARDREIREAVTRGEEDVEVMRIDHIIPRVGDLSSDPNSWYNQCAAEYYKLETISANQPGWD